MNVWYMLLIYAGAILLVLVFLAVSVAAMMNAVVKQKAVGKRLALLIAAVVLAGVVLLFTSSHKTYYRFNDWLIKSGTASDVIERFGKPDIGTYAEGEPGRIGYYIYTDNGPVMPDHLEHFYFIAFDEQGKVTEVSDSIRPGG